MALRSLLIDFNSYFASMEQHEASAGVLMKKDCTK